MSTMALPVRTGSFALLLIVAAAASSAQPRHEWVAEFDSKCTRQRYAAAGRLFDLGAAGVVAHDAMLRARSKRAEWLLRRMQPRRGAHDPLGAFAVRHWRERVLDLAGQSGDARLRSRALRIARRSWPELTDARITHIAAAVRADDADVVRAAVPFAIARVKRLIAAGAPRRVATSDLVALLDSPHERVRVTMLDDCDELPPLPALFEALRGVVRNLTDTPMDRVTKRALFRAIAHHGGAMAVPDLIAALGDPDVDRVAARALCELDRYQAVLGRSTVPGAVTRDALDEALSWGAMVDAAACSRYVAALPLERVVELFREASTHRAGELGLRGRALEALAHPTVEVRVAILAAMAEPHWSDESHVWFDATVRAAVVACLQHPDRRVRVAACGAIAQADSDYRQAFAGPMLAACADGDPAVRVAAAMALARFERLEARHARAIAGVLRETPGRAALPLLLCLRHTELALPPRLVAARMGDRCTDVARAAVELATTSMARDLFVLACNPRIDGSVRSAAADRLGRLPRPASTYDLVGCVRLVDGALRSQIVEALRERLDDASPAERTAILSRIERTALSVRVAPLAQPSLRDALRVAADRADRGVDIPAAVWGRLGAARPLEVTAAIAPLLASPNPARRARGLDYAVARSDTERVLPIAWIRRLALDADPRVRRAALTCLAPHGADALPWLRAVLVHGDPSDRAHALAVLAEAARVEPADVDAYRRLLHAASAAVRWGAIRALHRARVTDRRVRIRFAELVGADPDPEVRLAAALALEAGADPETRRAIATMLRRDDTPALRALADTIAR